MARSRLLMTYLMIMLTTRPEGLWAQTTCGAVTKLYSGTTYVTCHFEQDISELGFNVQFFTGDGAKPETALACNRMKDGSLNCRMASGVTFDEHQAVRYQLSFSREAALNRPGSQYLCQAVPAAIGVSAQRCTVAEIDIQIQEPTTNGTPSPDTDHSFTIVIAVFALVGIVITAIVTAVISCAIVYRKQKRIAERLTENMEKITSAPHTGVSALTASQTGVPAVPEGWPTHFYNMGWRDALGIGTEAQKSDQGSKQSQGFAARFKEFVSPKGDNKVTSQQPVVESAKSGAGLGDAQPPISNKGSVPSEGAAQSPPGQPLPTDQTRSDSEVKPAKTSRWPSFLTRRPSKPQADPEEARSPDELQPMLEAGKQESPAGGASVVQPLLTSVTYKPESAIEEEPAKGPPEKQEKRQERAARLTAEKEGDKKKKEKGK